MSRRVALVFWTVAGSMHFVQPRFYEAMEAGKHAYEKIAG